MRAYAAGVWSVLLLSSLAAAADSGRALIEAVKHQDKTGARALLI